ncbi:TetR family transcriptional regulator [Saccharopolyspora sp. 5N708]|uniref:TetR family transcriptional regulator n=1 Tax=Saccharopolyspora sp. 5N708 TaxID=3457424 RepID=UPI003FD5530F
MAERRQAIIAAARELLTTTGVAELTLRALSERVGLAKSNVLRYYDSREAVLLTVLDEEWAASLDDVEAALRDLPAAAEPGFARAVAVAGRVATTLARRPVLCELASAMATVLERNVSLEFARGFKTSAAEHNGRMTRLVAEHVGLPEPAAAQFTEAVVVTTSGLWPYTHPSEVSAQVTAEWGQPAPAETFADQLAELLANHLVGIVARGQATQQPQP